MGDRKRFQRVGELAAIDAGCVQISGLSEGRIAPPAGLISKLRMGQILIVTPNYGKAKRLAQDLSFFTDKTIYVIPEEEQAFLKYEAKSHENLEQRLSALAALRRGERCIVIAPVLSAVKKLAPKDAFDRYITHIELGDDVELEELRRRLTAMGYERANFVEARGQYGIRGGILDLYPVDSPLPVRVELFDTQVDSIRTFDPISQRSVEQMEGLDIYPAVPIVMDENAFLKAEEQIRKAFGAELKKMEKKQDEFWVERRSRLEAKQGQLLEYLENRINMQYLENYIPYFYSETHQLADYLMTGGAIFIDDPDRIGEAIALREREVREDFEILLARGEAIPSDFNVYPTGGDLKQLYEKSDVMPVYLFTPFQKQVRGVERLYDSFNIASRQTPVFNGRMDFLETELKRYEKQGYDTVIVCSASERVENMKNFLERCDMSSAVCVEQGTLLAGMEFPEEKLVWLSDADIFVSHKHRKSQSQEKKKNGKPIKAFTDIRKGDFVVHENHGIGKFIGVEQMDIQGIKKDYLKIKYAGEDMLYVPVEQMDAVQKYVGSEGAAPRVNKLTGGEWKKTKARAKAAIQDMAKELLKLSAERQMQEGHAFEPDTPWQSEFEDMFPYQETSDQLRCIEEIKADMERAMPMDRLLCGDVGYGKTEVAARAIFKCLADGKQAAVLVPTTILANQHYYTFKDRFEHFPFRVEMLCRFRTDRQQNQIIDQIGKGSVDLVVGTHRLLSKDVKFHDLGLLVIDEEQRFGVQHKEVIKQLKKNVDVLTLSATPIPRTLHMSLVGIKNMSLIEEPPEERYPVQTYVMEQDDGVIREAVCRELDRGGQVYVVYNRVRGIQKIASLIRELAPEASVTVGHGQMNEKQLEDVMLDFVDNKYNVMVATTIIESGLDIPNVNTILIIDADKYGLSQLYQLRGRVGRSNRMAYAYLMYQKDKVLSEHSEKRLRAIREFTEFGSGFRIAMRDLEIRGAGNVLGTEQSGHMINIGYELYCKLVEESVRQLGGEPVAEPQEECAVDLEIPAYLPDKYIDDELLKLQMYKKIAAIADADDESEIVDELLDRFGDIPKEALNLISVARVKSMAQKAGIQRVYQEQKKLVYEFGQVNRLTPKHMSDLSAVYGMNLFIHGGVHPYIRCGIGAEAPSGIKLGSGNGEDLRLVSAKQFLEILLG